LGLVGARPVVYFVADRRFMIESLMLCGIGLLGGCLLMLFFFSVVHERAARLTKKRLVEATPLTVSEIQADKDALRAQFAMSVRRLEISMEEMRAKTATRQDGVGKHTAELSRLHLELDKKAALIFALRAREEVRRNIVRRIAKILLYIYMRSKRRRRPAVFMPQQYPQWDLREAGPSELAAAAALNVKRRQAASRSY
jgi:hypothetical protein